MVLYLCVAGVKSLASLAVGFGLLLFYATSKVFQSHRGGDFMYEMSWNRKPEPTLLPNQGIFYLAHHIDIVWEQPAFDNAVSYTQPGKDNVVQHRVAAGMASPMLYQMYNWGLRIFGLQHLVVPRQSPIQVLARRNIA